MNSASIALPSSNLRDPEEFQKAARHSRRVRIYKKLLPLAAFSLVVVFIGSVILSYTPIVGVEIDKIGLSGGNLVMQNPKMSGVDKNNRPYSMIANQAIQNMEKPNVVRLVDINAELPMDDKSNAQLSANKGVYNSEYETMRLIENVEITGARGMDISLEEADIDIKTGKLISNKPVIVKSANTDISSDSLIVENNGEAIIFNKRVRMIIKKPISRGAGPHGPPIKPFAEHK